MKKCPNCGSENKDTAKFCKSCGNSLQVAESNSVMDRLKELLRNIARYFSGITRENAKEKLLNPILLLTYAALIVVVICLCISYSIGRSALYNEQWLLNQDELTTMVEKKKSNEIVLEKQRTEILSNSDVIAGIHDYISTKKQRQDEISTLESKIEELTGNKNALSKEANDLKKEIKDLKAQKEKLTGEIAQAKGKGYTLTAGVYTGGDDIPVGTYNIEWVSGSGNVFVGNTHTGDLVNEIFGKDSSWGYIKTYKNVNISYGTEIEIRSNLKVRFKAKD